jgi:hypothetical protein
MIIVMTRLNQTSGIFLLGLFFVGTIIFSGCESGDDVEPQNNEIDQIVIVPRNASIAVGEQFEFSAVGLTATGDTIERADLDLDHEWIWWSTDTDVFTVENDGTATGHNPGEAFCVLEFSESESQIRLKWLHFNDSVAVHVF